MRELLRQFAGQKVPGQWLGLQEEPFQLPAMVRVETYCSPDGQVEIDAVAQTAAGGTWAVEVKWGQRQVSRRELERLQANVHSAQLQEPVTLWCISRAGFSQEARDHARAHGILLTAREGFEALAQALD